MGEIMEQAEAINFLREFAKGKTHYRVAKILGVNWNTVNNWLSEKPRKISYEYLIKLEQIKNESPKPSNP